MLRKSFIVTILLASVFACKNIPEEIAVTSVTINMDRADMIVGESLQLSATVSPTNASEKTVIWSSSKQSVASISESGLVTAIAEGSSTITAFAGGKTATCLISVENSPVTVSSIELNRTNAKLTVEETMSLTAVIKPDNATDKSIIWASSSPVAATVEDGLVKAVGVGSTRITASAGDKSAVCEVVVTSNTVPVESIELNYDKLTLVEGETEKLIARVKPDNATDQSIVWTSSAPEVATVEDGLVKAVGAGSVRITASAGDKSAVCEVFIIRAVPVWTIELNYDNLTLFEGDSQTLVATVQPSNATNKSIIWTSSSPSVATVEDGLVKALTSGNTVITAVAGEKMAQCYVEVIIPGPPAGKEVYIPKEFRQMDFSSEDSNWCWQRSYATKDIIIFWEKGFGRDPSSATWHNGKRMAVNVQRLATQIQIFYDLYKNDLKFILPGSKADRYRMMVLLEYSDGWTTRGGSIYFDDTIGSLWVTPSLTEDTTTLAHELGHSFQNQLSIDDGTGFGSGVVYEITSQWMVWQTDPHWYQDYWWDDLLGTLHKASLHLNNMYGPPYVFEAWSNDRGQTFIADLWRAAKKRNDVIEVYEDLTGLSHAAFCDEQFQICRRLATFDYDRAGVREACAKYAGFRNSNGSSASSSYGTADDEGWRTIASTQAPQQYGFNRLKMTDSQRSVSFRSETEGWRYGFVGIKADGTPVYSDVYSAAEGEATFDTPETFKEIWFIVMAAPATHQPLDPTSTAYKSYTYRIKY